MIPPTTIVARKLQTVGFGVDYYTQGKLCFAERMNEAVINYDGKVFKCTTISDFNSEYSYGNLDLESGQIVWNVPKLAKDYNTFSPDVACLAGCILCVTAHAPIGSMRETQLAILIA